MRSIRTRLHTEMRFRTVTLIQSRFSRPESHRTHSLLEVSRREKLRPHCRQLYKNVFSFRLIVGCASRWGNVEFKQNPLPGTGDNAHPIESVVLAEREPLQSSEQSFQKVTRRNLNIQSTNCQRMYSKGSLRLLSSSSAAI